MPEPKKVSVSKLRKELPDILHRIHLLGESFVVVKNGRTFAVLSPVREGGAIEKTQEIESDSGEVIPADDVFSASPVS